MSPSVLWNSAAYSGFAGRANPVPTGSTNTRFANVSHVASLSHKPDVTWVGCAVSSGVRIRRGPNPMKCTIVELAPGPPFQRKITGCTPLSRDAIERIRHEAKMTMHVAGLVVADGDEANVHGIAQSRFIDADLVLGGHQLRFLKRGDLLGQRDFGKTQYSREPKTS